MSRLLHPSLRATLFAGALLACGRERPAIEPAAEAASNLPVSEPTRRDSAGIAIVENSGVAWTLESRWRIDEQPHVDIGGAERGEADDFYEVNAAILADDGRVVIADSWSRMLHVFDTTGTPIATWARGPTGSGTLFSVARMRRLPAGSVLVEGGAIAGTYTVFDSTGSTSRQNVRSPDRMMVAGEGPGPGGRPRLIARFSDRSLLSSRELPRSRDATDGVVPFDALLLRIDTTGLVLDSIGVVFAGEEAVSEIDGRVNRTPAGFARKPVIDVHEDRIVYADPRTFEVRIAAPDGALRRIVRARFEPRPIDSVAIAGYRRERFAAIDQSYVQNVNGAPAIFTPLIGIEAAMRKRDLTERLDRMRYPPTAPAFDRVLIDPDGTLWFEHFRMPGDRQPRWTLIDSTGRQLGMVDMPRGVYVLDVGREFVVGRTIDLNDAPHIGLYRIRKAARS